MMRDCPAYSTIVPNAAQAALSKREILLVDVREPLEYAAERIPGAMLFPLSTFNPEMLPQEEARPVVLHCGSGKRSADALNRCRLAGVVIAGHVEGGIAAWKSAGLMTLVLDPATGRISERK
jgi:rhodanese-related sulfurtransferase